MPLDLRFPTFSHESVQTPPCPGLRWALCLVRTARCGAVLVPVRSRSSWARFSQPCVPVLAAQVSSDFFCSGLVSWPPLLATSISLSVARWCLQYLHCLRSHCIPVLCTACALLVFNGFLPVITLSFLALCSFMRFPCGSQKPSFWLKFKRASLVETAFARHYLQSGGTQTALPERCPSACRSAPGTAQYLWMPVQPPALLPITSVPRLLPDVSERCLQDLCLCAAAPAPPRLRAGEGASFPSQLGARLLFESQLLRSAVRILH